MTKKKVNHTIKGKKERKKERKKESSLSERVKHWKCIKINIIDSSMFILIFGLIVYFSISTTCFLTRNNG